MLPLYEEIIRTGAWWDLVDGVSHRLCGLLQTHREDMSSVLRRWSTDADPWIRRAAITAQLGAKSATDPALLAAVIEPNLADPGSLSGRRSGGPCVTTPPRTRTGSGTLRRGTARR